MAALLSMLAFPVLPLGAQSSSSRARTTKSAENSLDPGSVAAGSYRNKTLGFACKIPDGWVLRTAEMNAASQESSASESSKADAHPARLEPKVLLAAFSRPPEATGQEVNSSILIAAEPATAYPGLTDAVQYVAPLSEVAQAQGFMKDEDPYEVAMGPRTLVRADFHKDVGSRVMRQSTLVMLSHGYAVSITVISGTDDAVEQLLDGLDFSAPSRSAK